MVDPQVEIALTSLQANVQQLTLLREGPAPRVAKSITDINFKEVSPGQRALLFSHFDNKPVLVLSVLPIGTEMLLLMGVVKGTNELSMWLIAAHSLQTEVVLVSPQSEELKRARSAPPPSLMV